MVQVPIQTSLILYFLSDFSDEEIYRRLLGNGMVVIVMRILSKRRQRMQLQCLNNMGCQVQSGKYRKMVVAYRRTGNTFGSVGRLNARVMVYRATSRTRIAVFK